MDASIESQNGRKSISLSEVLNTNPNCVPPPLSIGDKIIWLSDNGTEEGVVKWLGNIFYLIFFFKNEKVKLFYLQVFYLMSAKIGWPVFNSIIPLAVVLVYIIISNYLMVDFYTVFRLQSINSVFIHFEKLL